MAKRLIDADEIENLFYAQVEHGATDLMDAFDDALQDATTVDAVEVCYCKDCKHMEMITPDNLRWCNVWNAINGMGDYGYCNYSCPKGGQAPQREDV